MRSHQSATTAHISILPANILELQPKYCQGWGRWWRLWADSKGYERTPGYRNCRGAKPTRGKWVSEWLV